MDSLFGLSMTTIMIVLVSLLAISLGSVAYVALRNRIFFAMGLRNIPRRTAQTVLIVLGLMLSTLIISAAFGTGDTLNHSISKQAYTLLGHVDVAIEQDNLATAGDSEGATGLDIPSAQYERFRTAVAEAGSSDIDGVLGVRMETVPVTNLDTGLSEPVMTLTGLDAGALAGFPDVLSVRTGETLDVGSLQPQEVYINKSAARELDTSPGDRIRIFVDNKPTEFTIVDVVEDRVLTGVGSESIQQGLVTRLDTLHQVFGHSDLSFIAVSLTGGVRDTLDLTDSVELDLQRLIRQNRLALDISSTKKADVEFAELLGNFMTTFFLLLGLFSIGAGVLLIIMIFVMLAAERKPEMGMARAVGTKRGHLVQTFLSEGMAYNVVAAMVGAGLGVLVAFGMASAMGAIFSSGDFQLSIEPHITPRTLIVSYSLGVVLTFATVTFSSWRVSTLNIVAAIRGTEDDRRPVQQRVTQWRWVLLALPAMAVPPLGLWLLCRKGLGLAWSSWWVLFSIPAFGIPPLGLWLLLRNGFGLPAAWIISWGGLILGALLVVSGMSSDLAFPFALGCSLFAAGAARGLTHFLKLPHRPVFTAAGLALLVTWGLTAGGRIEPLVGVLSGDIEMFFLSGVAMVTASTYVLVYNADVILAGVSRLGDVFGTILPALKTAIAYPLANRFRTGMTVAMISLVVFSLTMMSTMNLNFNELFLADDSRGGWDIVVEENANNPIPDLPARLREAGSTAPDGFRSEGVIGRAEDPYATNEVRQGPDGKFDSYLVIGMDDGFISASNLPVDHHARGFESDAAVREALLTRDDVAVIDAFAIGSGGFSENEYGFSVSGIRERIRVFDPIPLELRDPVSGQTRKITLIGVMGEGASSNFVGLHIPLATYKEVFGDPELSWHYVGLKDSSQSRHVAKAIESTLLTAGVQAESLKARAEADSALFRNFFYLMQGYMGLGLFVGIAAVGVIAFRTVVERRQQIGMLRAIGYKRSTVALSFMLETSFVTLLAIFSGVGLAIWLSYMLITSDEFPEGASYHVPWLQIAFFSAFTYLASLVMTFIPARQAASIPTAEALRYE